jgi:hypothetical protein
MNCEDAISSFKSTTEGGSTDLESRKAAEHIAGCDECRDALMGIAALHKLRDQEPVQVPADFFRQAMQSVTTNAKPQNTGFGFWHGMGIGAAVAASLTMAFMISFNTPSPQADSTSATPEFLIVMNEPRNVNIAIDAGRDLLGATVSVFLAGGVELAGYGNKREISWTTDLDKGVNHLQLPVIATDLHGGTVLVRLDHEGEQKVFLVNLIISS